MTDQTLQEQIKNSFNTSVGVLQQTCPPVDPVVRQQLARLALLYGMPFENLVPDARMLPPESLRFFYLDTNWLESLVDGAMSVGVHSDRDIRFHRVMQHIVRQVTDEAAGKHRAEQRDEEATSSGFGDKTKTGFLLRSAIVTGWPGLEMQAFTLTSKANRPSRLQLLSATLTREDLTKLSNALQITIPKNLTLPLLADDLFRMGVIKRVPPLRLERLAPDVMLAIFEDIPDLIVLNEPPEDLHFGIRGGSIQVRGFIDGTEPPPNTPAISINDHFRNQDKESGVLDIAALSATLASNVPRPAGTAFGSGLFAIQMIDPADQKFFIPSS